MPEYRWSEEGFVQGGGLSDRAITTSAICTRSKWHHTYDLTEDSMYPYFAETMCFSFKGSRQGAHQTIYTRHYDGCVRPTLKRFADQIWHSYGHHLSYEAPVFVDVERVSHAELLHVTTMVLTNQRTSSLSSDELAIAIAAMEKLSSVSPNIHTIQVSDAVQSLFEINELLKQFVSDQPHDVVMEFTVLSERIALLYAQQTILTQDESASVAGSVIFVENVGPAPPSDWFTIGEDGEVGRTASLREEADVDAAIHCDVHNVRDVEGSLSVAVVYNKLIVNAWDGDALGVNLVESDDNETVTVINQTLISGILSFSLTDQSKKHSIPVTFTLQHEQELDEEEQTIVVEGISKKRRSRAKCVFWKKAQRFWSGEGCSLISNSSSSRRSSCRCDHTTSFAILMQVTEFEIPEVHKTALKWLTYLGCSISLFALVLTIFILTYLGSLRSDRTFIHKNLVVSLMISDLLFIAGVGETQIKIACKIIAVFLHFFYLSVFSWMLVEGLHLYNMVVRVFGSETSRWKIYSLVGWGLPVLAVAITTAIDHNGYGSDGGCWLIVDRGFIWAFVGPALGIILVNMAVMCMVIKIIVQSTNTKSTSNKEQAKAGMKGALLLLPLLGLTWAFGLMGVNSDTIVFQYLFTIFNSLQGLFVFLFHCVMNSEVRQAWRLKRKQIMLSRGEFIDSNSIQALGLNTSSCTTKHCDLTSVDYTVDPEEIHTSNLSTISDKVNDVQNIKLKGAKDQQHGRMARHRKRLPQQVLRCETPIEESIPGAILELDENDMMEEVRVTHRIIENDDWTVEEKRHVTRKLTKRKQQTDQSEPREDASSAYGATPAGRSGIAPPPYVMGKSPSYFAPDQQQRDDGMGGASIGTPPMNDMNDKPISNGSVDLAIKNALFNGGGYPQSSKGAGKGVKLPVPRPQGYESKMANLPTYSGSGGTNPSPTTSFEAELDAVDSDSDSIDMTSSTI